MSSIEILPMTWCSEAEYDEQIHSLVKPVEIEQHLSYADWNPLYTAYETCADTSGLSKEMMLTKRSFFVETTVIEPTGDSSLLGHVVDLNTGERNLILGMHKNGLLKERDIGSYTLLRGFLIRTMDFYKHLPETPFEAIFNQASGDQ